MKLDDAFASHALTFLPFFDTSSLIPQVPETNVMQACMLEASCCHCCVFPFWPQETHLSTAALYRDPPEYVLTATIWNLILMFFISYHPFGL